ncbi:YjcZ family sporulation protein [Brevibacillus dissolubilis]|nr:YjcZ family sporulation protein [Brevibacillus dissolubilis]
MSTSFFGGGFGDCFALILVLFILLVIVGAAED